VKKILIFTQKGGAAKTTTCINLAAALVSQKKTCAIMDLDPQANCSICFGIDPTLLNYTMKDLFTEDAKISDILLKEREILFFPSRLDLASLEFQFSSEFAKEKRLSNVMEGVTGPDYLLVDVGPHLGYLSTNALVYADEVLIPTGADALSISGMNTLLETIERVKESKLNPKLKLNGVLITNFSKNKTQLEIIEKLQKQFGKKLYKTHIRHSLEIPKAQKMGKTIFEYRPKSIGAQDYVALSKEFIKRTK